MAEPRPEPRCPGSQSLRREKGQLRGPPTQERKRGTEGQLGGGRGRAEVGGAQRRRVPITKRSAGCKGALRVVPPAPRRGGGTKQSQEVLSGVERAQLSVLASITDSTVAAKRPLVSTPSFHR